MSSGTFQVSEIVSISDQQNLLMMGENPIIVARYFIFVSLLNVVLLKN